MKFRHCLRCRKRTPHQEEAGGLCCAQCADTQQEAPPNIGSESAVGLRAAMKLYATYPRPANFFVVYMLQVCLKVCLVFWLVPGFVERGIFTSAFMLIVGVFAINCFGPQGREKKVAVEFGKQFWTTLVPR